MSNESFSFNQETLPKKKKKLLMLIHLVRFWEVCCPKNFSALPETKDLEENDQQD